MSDPVLISLIGSAFSFLGIVATGIVGKRVHKVEKNTNGLTALLMKSEYKRGLANAKARARRKPRRPSEKTSNRSSP